MRDHLKRYSEGVHNGVPLWRSFCGRTITQVVGPLVYEMDGDRDNGFRGRFDFCRSCVGVYKYYQARAGQ